MDWREAPAHTVFEGSLEADDIGEVLKNWRYAPTITSDSFVTNAALNWPGSPAAFALRTSSGTLGIEARDGMLQSGEGSAEALRVFGLLNFNALTRRLRLDFSDLFSKGTPTTAWTPACMWKMACCTASSRLCWRAPV
ncbi:AsmA-like C-terminal region-containing protein [Halopseudomonas pachastrellae]|nr:AsmA-like C-terminal region-containing protein [Halopseudomonas pachastrellae]